MLSDLWSLLTVHQPDNKFLLVSSRGEAKETNPGDPIITFSIDAENGSLERVQILGTGGKIPRQFSISKDGKLVAVGTGNGEVKIFQRDVLTGNLSGPIASTAISGEVTCVIFDE